MLTLTPRTESQHHTRTHTHNDTHTAWCSTCGTLTRPQPGQWGLQHAEDVAELHELLHERQDP